MEYREIDASPIEKLSSWTAARPPTSSETTLGRLRRKGRFDPIESRGFEARNARLSPRALPAQYLLRPAQDRSGPFDSLGISFIHWRWRSRLALRSCHEV